MFDLERHRGVRLLPDREIATVAAFPADHKTISVLSRDRGGGYGVAATWALPTAFQVADRWPNSDLDPLLPFNHHAV